MPLASSLERLQPCLFERLIDLNPDQRLESRIDRSISMARYRDGVLRDLGWLLNSSTHLKNEGLDEFPEVMRSVFNFGKRDLSGLVLSTLEPRKLEEEITRAIRLFEPRIVPESLTVKCVAAGGKAGRKIKAHGSYNCLAFEITGEIWAQPFPEKFFVKTELDLETGIQRV